MDTRAKAQNAIDAVGFNSLAELSFPSVVLSGTTQNNGVVAARLWVPTTVKIYRVIAGIFGSVAGTVSLNVVAGEAAEVPNTGATQFLSMPIPDTDYAQQPIAPNTQAYPPAYATAGQKLFLADRALTITNGVATVLTPDDSAASGAYAPTTPGKAYDGLWGPGGTELTLRLPSSGATGTVQVRLLVKYYDPTYNKPVLTGFNPATDIP